jgi:hypothetical protein
LRQPIACRQRSARAPADRTAATRPLRPLPCPTNRLSSFCTALAQQRHAPLQCRDLRISGRQPEHLGKPSLRGQEFFAQLRGALDLHIALANRIEHPAAGAEARKSQCRRTGPLFRGLYFRLGSIDQVPSAANVQLIDEALRQFEKRLVHLRGVRGRVGAHAQHRQGRRRVRADIDILLVVTEQSLEAVVPIERGESIEEFDALGH